MIRRLVISPLSWVLVAATAVFAGVAGFQLGGGTVPGVPQVDNELLYIGTATIFGLGVFGLLLKRPDVIGRIAPTVYVVVALLPLLRFTIPGITLARFIPLALLAPVVYSLYRRTEPISAHTRIARVAVFAAFATAAVSLIANRTDTDHLRLLLMVGGIVLLVGAAPRAWPMTWRTSVERAVAVAFWGVVISTVVLLPFAESYIGDRLRGAFVSPNTLGALLALATPIAASRSRLAPVHWMSAFVLVIMSGSRGGLLALSLAAVVLLLRRRRFVQVGLFLGLATVVLGAGMVRTQADHEVNLGVNTRQLVWSDVANASLERPVVGHGFGSVGEIEFSARTQRFAGAQPQTHSSWLDGFYEQGLFSLVFWIVLILVGFRTAWVAGPSWIATLCAGVTSATFESWLFSIGGGLGSLFWLIFGAMALAVRVDSVEKVFGELMAGDSGGLLEIPQMSQPVSAPGKGVEW